MPIWQRVTIFIGGWVWFFVWTAIAIWGFGAKITPPVTPQRFFGPYYSRLFPANTSRFDPQHPDRTFIIDDAHRNQLKSWGLNDCVATDGTAAQDTSFFGTGCFCENAPAVRAVFEGGFAIQPANTLSTLPLSLVGLLILGFLVFSDPPPLSNFMTDSTWLYLFPLSYGAMTIFLGPASMMLHLGLRDWGGWWDSLSLYVWFSFVLCFALLRLLDAAASSYPGWARGLFLCAWAVCIAVPAALTAPGVNTGIKAEYLYLLLGIPALIVEGVLCGLGRYPTRWELGLDNIGGRTWFAFGGGAFFLALVIWLLSFTQKPLCFPNSPLQGHAIFHTLSAVAAGCLYKYYRHEGEVAG